MLNKRDLQSIREVVKEEAGNKVETLRGEMQSEFKSVRGEMRDGFGGIRLEFAEVIAESVLPKFDEVYERFDKLESKVDLTIANTVHKSQLNVMMNDLRRKRKPKST